MRLDRVYFFFKSPPLSMCVLSAVTNMWQTEDVAWLWLWASCLLLSPLSSLFSLVSSLLSLGSSCSSSKCALAAVYLLLTDSVCPLFCLSSAWAAYANCVLIAWPCGCQPVRQSVSQAVSHSSSETIDLLPLLTFRQAKRDLARLVCQTASK